MFLVLLACSTNPPAPAPPDAPAAAPDKPAAATDERAAVPADSPLHGLVGPSYQARRMTITSPAAGTFEMRWEDMEGQPVRGDLRLDGDTLHVRWDRDAQNTLNQIWTGKLLDPCAFEITYQKWRNGAEKTDPVRFVSADPACASWKAEPAAPAADTKPEAAPADVTPAAPGP